MFRSGRFIDIRLGSSHFHSNPSTTVPFVPCLPGQNFTFIPWFSADVYVILSRRADKISPMKPAAGWCHLFIWQDKSVDKINRTLWWWNTKLITICIMYARVHYYICVLYMYIYIYMISRVPVLKNFREYMGKYQRSNPVAVNEPWMIYINISHEPTTFIDKHKKTVRTIFGTYLMFTIYYSTKVYLDDVQGHTEVIEFLVDHRLCFPS